MEDDWDLHAVVRGCAALATTTSSAATTTTSVVTSQNFSTFQDLIEPRRERFVEEELHELYKPFFSKSLESSQLQFSLPILPPAEQVTKQLPLQRQKLPSFSVSGVPKAHNSIPRSKRRKNHLKRVCHVAAENLSSDMWSWRKYGQKPIKGSPYPRGYYRCSTSKGCMARKQVERNRSDPGMFIVTYTAEHNHAMPTHRNSLAGSTRQKPDDPGKASCSPELSVSAVPEKLESSREDLADAEDDDDDLSVSKTEVDDDFFAGLEDFTGPDGGDHTSANLQFPWLSSGAATIAGGG